MSVTAIGTTHQAMHFNFVPGNPAYMAAAISFVVDERGCCSAQFKGDDHDAVEFLEMFQMGDVADYPEFFDYCERQGLPVVRGPLAVDQRPAPYFSDPKKLAAYLEAEMTQKNLDQVLSDVLDEMNADAAAIATTTQEDDAF